VIGDWSTIDHAHPYGRRIPRFSWGGCRRMETALPRRNGRCDVRRPIAYSCTRCRFTLRYATRSWASRSISVEFLHRS